MKINTDNFDLSDWRLGLPIDKAGTNKGVMLSIDDLSDYKGCRFFFCDGDDAITFRANANGATSGNSDYARSELREKNGDQKAEWSLKEGGVMTATLKIDEMPTRYDGTAGKVVIGQIHGGTAQLVRLYYSDNQIFFVNDKSGPNNKPASIYLTNQHGEKTDIGINEKFSYKISTHGNTLDIQVFADGQTYSSVTKINSVWNAYDFYFKAGLYLGVNETKGHGFGQTTFYGLDVSHQPGKGLDGWKVGMDHAGSPDTGGDKTPPAPAPVPKPDTNDHTVLHGNSGNDKLVGQNSGDKIFGNEGRDKLYGLHGNDLLSGGNGSDWLYGGDGNDRLYGGGGIDILKGGMGGDKLYGGAGADVIRGGHGNDVFVYEDIIDAGDRITDFRTGDKINLHGLIEDFTKLHGTSANALIDSGHITIVESDRAHHVDIMIDVDGHAGRAHAVLLTTLDIGRSTDLPENIFIV